MKIKQKQRTTTESADQNTSTSAAISKTSKRGMKNSPLDEETKKRRGGEFEKQRKLKVKLHRYWETITDDYCSWLCIWASENHQKDREGKETHQREQKELRAMSWITISMAMATTRIAPPFDSLSFLSFQLFFIISCYSLLSKFINIFPIQTKIRTISIFLK